MLQPVTRAFKLVEELKIVFIFRNLDNICHVIDAETAAVERLAVYRHNKSKTALLGKIGKIPFGFCIGEGIDRKAGNKNNRSQYCQYSFTHQSILLLLGLGINKTIKSTNSIGIVRSGATMIGSICVASAVTRMVAASSRFSMRWPRISRRWEFMP